MALLVNLRVSSWIQFHELLRAAVDAGHEVVVVHADDQEGTDLANLVCLPQGFLTLVGDGHGSGMCPALNCFWESLVVLELRGAQQESFVKELTFLQLTLVFLYCSLTSPCYQRLELLQVFSNFVGAVELIHS